MRKNLEDYSLDLSSMRWQQITQRNWKEFLVRLGQRKLLNHAVWMTALEQVIPTDVAVSVLPEAEWNHITFVVEGVAVSMRWEHDSISIVVEGALEADLVRRIVDEIRGKFERVVDAACVVDEL